MVERHHANMGGGERRGDRRAFCIGFVATAMINQEKQDVFPFGEYYCFHLERTLTRFH